MLELTPSLINSSGTKVSETCPEESESESQEKEVKKKDQTNGTHSSNTLMLKPSPTDSLRKLKSPYDFHHYLNLFTRSLPFLYKNKSKSQFSQSFK